MSIYSSVGWKEENIRTSKTAVSEGTEVPKDSGTNRREFCSEDAHTQMRQEMS